MDLSNPAVLYALLYGCFPFWTQERKLATQKKKSPKISFTDKKLPHKLSKNAKSLLKGMLEVKPEKRCTMDQAENHKWFQ